MVATAADPATDVETTTVPTKAIEIEDDVLKEQKRESTVSLFLSQKRAALQKPREFSTDFRGLRDVHSARWFRLRSSHDAIGKFSADLALFFDTVQSVGVLCLLLSCLTFDEILVDV